MSKTKIFLCIVGALLVHAVIITFGGILFLSDETVQSSRRDIELLNEDVQKDKDKVEEEKEVVQPDLKAPSDAPPDPNQVLAAVDTPSDSNNPRVEKSSHPQFEAPALAAVRQWKFEPAIKAGQRVSCRMRVPIRFQPS